MKVKLILERQRNAFTDKYRKIVEVDIPDTDNTEADEKGVWVIVGYSEVKEIKEK